MADEIHFGCPRCGKKLRAPARVAGGKIKCPGCEAILRVPTRGPQPAAARAAPPAAAPGAVHAHAQAQAVVVRTSALAVSSLVLGILGLLCFGILTALPGVICGHMARSRIRRDRALVGNGLAMGGLVTSYITVILTVLLVAAFVLLAASGNSDFQRFMNQMF